MNPELVNSPHCRLSVFGSEVGGRWNQTALVNDLAQTKAGRAPAYIQAEVGRAYLHRWWNILSLAARTAVGVSFLHQLQAEGPSATNEEIPLSEALQAAAYVQGPTLSQLASENS